MEQEHGCLYNLVLFAERFNAEDSVEDELMDLGSKGTIVWLILLIVKQSHVILIIIASGGLFSTQSPPPAPPAGINDPAISVFRF